MPSAVLERLSDNEGGRVVGIYHRVTASRPYVLCAYGAADAPH